MNIDDSQFSEREKDIVRLLLQAKSNKQIALELGISNRTVEFHLGNVYAKLGVASRAEATLKLAENHLWKTTGNSTSDIQVKSTVDDSGDPTENGFKSILRRIPVKKLYYIIGGLLATSLIAVTVFTKLPASNLELTSATTDIDSRLPPTIDPFPSVTLPAPMETPQITSVVLPPHTVNGYTAAIESYYIDTSHVIFQVRITGGDVTFGNEHFHNRFSGTDIYDENGNLINSSGGFGPAIDPALIQFEFRPVTLLKGDHLKGQFAFNINNAPEYNQILAQFRFDFDLPIHPEVRFYPKQVITANGLEMLLDSVTITPTFTQVYLCFQPPSYAPWTIGSRTVLRIGEQEAPLYNSNLLFSSSTGGDRRAGSEPYWAPPTKNGSCIKVGFQAGSSAPTLFTLTIPELENPMPYLDINSFSQLPTLYPGLSEKQAYYKYLEEHDSIYKGPWVFRVELIP